ncbi:hypothetical protein [Gordonia sp. MMO-8]|uniref:hypothetical protein n=1 Tax=Gordonia sp. MMO-8 TaxID=3127886 RepID=UPI003018B7C0
MTGTDPAVEAARRAWETVGMGEDQNYLRGLKAGAREAFAEIRKLHKPMTIKLPGRSIFNVNGTYIGEVGGGEATVCAHCHSEWWSVQPARHCALCGDKHRDECVCDCRACEDSDHNDCEDNCGFEQCSGIWWADPKREPFPVAGPLWPCATARLIYTSEELNQ